MNKNILTDIISSTKKCLIIPHQSPDGDCLGSSFTLSNFLERHQIEHFIVVDDLIPSNYKFLEKKNMIKSEDVKDTYGYGIILDTSSMDRAGTTQDVIDRCDHIVVIDHHKTNAYFGDTNVVEMLSSVGELLYNMYQEIGYKIDQTDAIGLYTSIVTDTGEFRYSNTSSSTLRVAADLFDTGFDFESISKEIFSNQELEKVLLKSKSLSEMTVFCDGKVALMKVTQAMLKDLGCQMYHSDGIVEAGRDIAGVEVSVLLKEVEHDQVKVSLRSKSYLDVAEISLVYSGGGHVRAAGCTIYKDIDSAQKEILEEIARRL